MKPFDTAALPKKVLLSGSDCFHLVLDRHAKSHFACSNVIRMAFHFQVRLSSDRIKNALDKSPLIYWLCNIKLVRKSPFSIPFWQFLDRGNQMELHEMDHSTRGEIPDGVLLRDLPLSGNRFIDTDLVHYPDGSSVLVISWNHIVMDGKGFGMLLQHLTDLDEYRGSHSAYELFPQTEPKAGLFHHIRNMYAVKDFIDASSKPPIASVATQNSKIVRPFRYLRLALSQQETQQSIDRATQSGAKFGANLFYLSCCVHAVNRVLKLRKTAGTMWIPVPYDGRRRGSFGPLISNVVSYLFYRIPLKALGSMKETVGCLQAQMTEQIAAKMPQKYQLLLNMMRHLPLSLYYLMVNTRGADSFSSFVYSFTGEHFNGLSSLFGERIDNLMIVPFPTYPPGLTFIFLKHQEALSINITYSSDIVNTFELDCIIQELKAGLLQTSDEKKDT